MYNFLKTLGYMFEALGGVHGRFMQILVTLYFLLFWIILGAVIVNLVF